MSHCMCKHATVENQNTTIFHISGEIFFIKPLKYRHKILISLYALVMFKVSAFSVNTGSQSTINGIIKQMRILSSFVIILDRIICRRQTVTFC